MQEKETTTFESLKNINFDFIVNYCVRNGEVEWLKQCSHEPVPVDKNGNERRKSFIEIRSEFIEHFFPELKAKPKKPTIYDIIDSL